ncbi:MAG TPA: DUF58 domain-containing protein [Steroidobacteraceae bacterium]|nr:DUF58 domain-containing protein [Steroidobacteraceae bacterium]
MTTTGAETRARLLQPEVLAGLATLKLAARAAVEGTLIGMHRSTQFGFSQEFAEYRAYAEGDDPRFIDWNVYARSERLVVKRFLGETNTHLMLLLDASASMGFGAGTLSKLRYAQLLAASLAYLASRQHDAVGVAVFDETVRAWRAPSSRTGQLDGVLHVIDSATPAHRTDFRAPLEQLAASQPRRGMVALLSDFYVEPAALIERVRPLAWQGSDVMLLQILDPEERAPSLSEATLFQDMESGQRVEVSAQFAREHYPGRMRAHIESLRTAAAACGMQHLLLDTSVSLQLPLREYLLFRRRRR